MKLLLVAVNAKYTHMNPALYSIRASLGRYAEDTEIAEYTVNQFPKDVLRDIFGKKPDIIGFSVYIWNVGFIGTLLSDIKKILPDTRVYLGGPEAAWRKEEMLRRYPAADGVMFGEGEAVWPRLMDALSAPFSSDGGLKFSIPGLYTGDPDVSAPPLLSMDELPFPYTEDNIGSFRNRMLYYETSRGCPYHCAYCLSSAEEGLRFRSLDRVFPELDFFLEHRVRIVKFIDRTFNADDGRALSIWRYLAAHDNGVTRFHFEIEADILSDEAIAFLKTVRRGLFQLEIGVQTTDEAVLREIRRYAKTEKIKRVVTELSASGNIPLHTDLIAGLPGETLTGFIRSFNEVYRWGADELQLGFLKVLPGTEMAERADEYGLLYEAEAPYEILKNRWLSYGDIVCLKNVEDMLERYGNSGMFKASLPAFLRLFDTPFDMFSWLSDYAAAHTGLFEKQSRISAYRLLREAYAERVKAVYAAKGTLSASERADMSAEVLTACFDSLLLDDLYIREKLKARPDFFGDGETQRLREKAYLRDHGSRENVHIEFFNFDPEAYKAAGAVLPGNFARIYTYDGQGSAVSVRTEKL